MWHPGAHLRMGVVIGVVAKWRAVSDGALLGVLLFRVPREPIPINRELIPRECIFLSFSLQSCLHSHCILTSRQQLLPSCCDIFLFGDFLVFSIRKPSSPSSESTFKYLRISSVALKFLVFLGVCRLACAWRLFWWEGSPVGCKVVAPRPVEGDLYLV